MSEPGPETGCYVYQPDEDALSEAAAAPAPLNTITLERQEIFLSTWAPTQARLDNVLASADAGSVGQVCSWLSGLLPMTLDLIPTGLITTSTASSLFSKVAAQADGDILVISVPAAQCNNLKSTLKCIVSGVSSKPTTGSATTRLLGYDLETLRLYMQGERYEKVLLYFGNGESLHGGVLSDLVDVLDSWRNRIPFILVFETAVSIELFQEKLTRRALAVLRGEAFSTASSADVVEAIFKAVATDHDQKLWIGASSASLLIERQAEHLQSAQAFVSAVKYMYMIQFYRSPLSVLLGDVQAELTKEGVEFATKLKSFQAHVADLKKRKKTAEIKSLTKDGAVLGQLIAESIKNGHSTLLGVLDAVQAMSSIHEISPSKSGLSWSKLYVQAMSGQLLESPIVRNLLLVVRAMTSDSMQALLARFVELGMSEMEPLQTQLADVVASHAESGVLRSEHDQSLETTRTTVVAKKISLSKQKSVLTKGEAEYSALVKKISSTLDAYLKERLINPKTLLFNEVFIFDLQGPLKEAFAPKPRNKLERALTVPGAYLACECCEPVERSLSNTQPATSILYQLYLESGTLVNIADLWAAFEAVMSDEQDDANVMGEGGGIDDQKLALFYRSLAELKYLGLIKSSRTKADHLVKMRFLGL